MRRKECSFQKYILQFKLRCRVLFTVYCNIRHLLPNFKLNTHEAVFKYFKEDKLCWVRLLILCICLFNCKHIKNDFLSIIDLWWCLFSQIYFYSLAINGNLCEVNQINFEQSFHDCHRSSQLQLCITIFIQKFPWVISCTKTDFSFRVYRN